MEEMQEFNYFANDAWKGMQEFQLLRSPGKTHRIRVNLNSLFGRHKRQYEEEVEGKAEVVAGGGQCSKIYRLVQKKFHFANFFHEF
jgi:hypothetical protein